jgi:hypothetical protein
MIPLENNELNDFSKDQALRIAHNEGASLVSKMCSSFYIYYQIKPLYFANHYKVLNKTKCESKSRKYEHAL